MPSMQSINKKILIRLGSACVFLLLPSVLVAEETGSLQGRVIPPHDHDFVLSTAQISSLGLQVDIEKDGTFLYVLMWHSSTPKFSAAQFKYSGNDSTIKVKLAL